MLTKFVSNDNSLTVKTGKTTIFYGDVPSVIRREIQVDKIVNFPINEEEILAVFQSLNHAAKMSVCGNINSLTGCEIQYVSDEKFREVFANNSIEFEFSSLSSGVKHVMGILSYMKLYKNKTIYFRNVEVCLHPHSQTALGRFLCFMSSYNKTQIFIETRSKFFFIGFISRCLKEKEMKPSTVVINHFSGSIHCSVVNEDKVTMRKMLSTLLDEECSINNE